MLLVKVIDENGKPTLEFPSCLLEAIVKIEDRRFYSHFGVDSYAIVRAIFRNSTSQKLEGASTIVQQLVRTITGAKEIRILRKLKEMMLATLINQKFSNRRF
ncbi:MAG: transglycosylase domain-containing protein [Cyclobacteriaceae bacterium]